MIALRGWRMLQGWVCQAAEGRIAPVPPTILYEYQNTGLTKIAFRKSLIPKDTILVVWGTTSTSGLWMVRKAGASSRTPHAVIYNINYITDKNQSQGNSSTFGNLFEDRLIKAETPAEMGHPCNCRFMEPWNRSLRKGRIALTRLCAARMMRGKLSLGFTSLEISQRKV